MKNIKCVNVRLYDDEIQAYATLRRANYNVCGVIRAALLAKAREVAATTTQDDINGGK